MIGENVRNQFNEKLSLKIMINVFNVKKKKKKKKKKNDLKFE